MKTSHRAMISVLSIVGCGLAGCTTGAGGGADSPCGPDGASCASDEFCKRELGACDAPSTEGVCTALSEGCDETFTPVCGCDDKTYDNEREAGAAGVSVASEGKCAARACSVDDDSPCKEDEFCQLAEGNCSSGLVGVCIPIPDQICEDVPATVCGCDAVTYVNTCFAELVGVNVDHQGSCEDDDTGPTVPCGADGVPCADGEFCSLPVGSCDAPLGDGTCEAVPEICTEEFAPVCGCDGVEYSNACFAAAVGANIDRVGTCGDDGVGDGQDDKPGCGEADTPCEDSHYCILPEGSCDVPLTAGVCGPKAEICPDDVDPVCGCDGVQYDNACKASEAGVNTDHQGACIIGG